MLRLLRSKEEKVLVLVFAVLSMALIVDKILVGPMRTKLDSLNASIEVAEQQLSKDRAILARRDVIQSQYRKLVPSGGSGGVDAGDDWLRDVEKAAFGKVTIGNITPLPQVTRQSYTWEKVEVICRGNLNALSEFVYGMQQRPYRPQVQSMRIKAADDPVGTLDCHLEIARILLR